MSQERPSTLTLVLFAAAFLVVLGWMGTMAYQAFLAPEREAPPSFAEQVEPIAAVADVETDTQHIPGSPASARSTSSQITFNQQLAADPAATARELAAVTWGFSRSSWEVQGSRSTADVSYLGPVDEAPIRWWTEAVSRLEQTPAQDAVHCRITDFSLRCEADSDDPAATLEALAGIDGTPIGPWLEAARTDEGEEKGFELRIDGQTLTDPTALAG